MSIFDDYLKKYDKDSEEEPDIFQDALKNPGKYSYPIVYPTIDTRGKAPINDEPQGIIDFILDNLAASSGETLKELGGLSERYSRHGRDAEEWHNDPQNAWRRDWQETGQEIYDRNAHYYEPGTAEYYLSQAIQSTPSTIALGLMGAGAGAVAGSVIPGFGTAAGGIAGLARSAPRVAQIVKLLGQAGKAYLKGNTRGARVARAFTDPRRVTAAATSGYGEGLLEGQGAYDRASYGLFRRRGRTHCR